MLKKSLADIVPVLTSHSCGEKRVLLAKDETLSDITQIAITRLSKGTVVEEHVHPTMEEYFLLRSGRLIIHTDDGEFELSQDDFLGVCSGVKHCVTAVTDCELLTIGVAVEVKK